MLVLGRGNPGGNPGGNPVTANISTTRNRRLATKSCACLAKKKIRVYRVHLNLVEVAIKHFKRKFEVHEL